MCFLLSYENLKNDSEIISYVKAANDVLGAIGYTEHGLAHAVKTGTDASRILETLGYSERECELAKIAGLLHDTGNAINRTDHAQSGAFLAFELLRARKFPVEEVIAVTTAIGHHDEKTAAPVTPIAAALILADKSDVRTTRVRNKSTVYTDIHDRVNYAVFGSKIEVKKDKKLIILALSIDTLICPVMEYFEIFLDRMVLCKKSAAFLGCDFELIINDTRLL
ncbi:MAG: HD domain-containing protein [Ruminococcaceae bacterium]|nr:HD domain-containing protein [Oscillospiraceae bacterium]